MKSINLVIAVAFTATVSGSFALPPKIPTQPIRVADPSDRPPEPPTAALEDPAVQAAEQKIDDAVREGDAAAAEQARLEHQQALENFRGKQGDNATPPSSPPSSNPFDNAVVNVGDQQIKGWEQDPIMVQRQISGMIQQMNLNIENWDKREGSSYAQGLRHQGIGQEEGIDAGAFAGQAPEQPSMIGAIRAAGLPERGFVFKRVPQQDGTTAFDIFAWPPNDPTSAVLLQLAGKMLAEKEQQLRSLGTGAGGSTQSNGTGGSANANNGGIVNDVKVNLPSSAFANRFSDFQKEKKEAAKAEKTKEVAKQVGSKQKSLDLAALKEGYKLGKAVGSALAKAGSIKPGDLKPMADDLSSGSFRISVPAGTATPSRGIASLGPDSAIGMLNEGSLEIGEVSSGNSLTSSYFWKWGRAACLAIMALALGIVLFPHVIHRKLTPVVSAAKEKSKEKSNSEKRTAVTVLDKAKNRRE